MSDNLSQLYHQPFEVLGLSQNLNDILHTARLNTVEDIVELLFRGPAALIGLKGMNPRYVEELIETLRAKKVIE